MFPSVASGHVICAFGELMQDQNMVLGDSVSSDGRIESPVVFSVGGCAPLTLTAAACFGIPARLIGHFGEDPISSSLSDELQRHGVRVHGIRRGKGATSVNIQMANGDTASIYDPGDSRSIRADEVHRRWLWDAAVLHLNSYHLFAEETAPVFWRFVELAHEEGIPISLDASSANGLLEFGVEDFREALAHIEPAVFFANDAEAQVLDLDSRFPQGPSVVIHKGRTTPTRVSMVSDDVWEVPVPGCDRIVSTVGAGDAFAGGFLAGWVQNRSLRGAVELGHMAAVQSIQTYGVSGPVRVIDPLAKVG